MADGSRNNPADVHRTSRTSLQFHCNPLGTTFHIQHRSIQTKVNTVSHTTTQELLKKKPEGCAEGPWLYGPFAVFHSFPKQKNQALCQESKNKTKNQPHNKQRKRKSQRKIKKKNKRKIKEKKHDECRNDWLWCYSRSHD